MGFLIYEQSLYNYITIITTLQWQIGFRTLLFKYKNNTRRRKPFSAVSVFIASSGILTATALFCS